MTLHARPTQVRVLLRMLREAGSDGVSAHDVVYRAGIARPAARVWNLKQAGFSIRTGPRKAGEMARYFLEPVKPLDGLGMGVVARSLGLI